MNEKLFHAASQAINIDIICMEGSEKLPYLPRKTDVACAISRGICFEVSKNFFSDLFLFETSQLYKPQNKTTKLMNDGHVTNN